MTELLLANKDDAYAEFQRKLIPDIPPGRVIGVRTPVLKEIARGMRANGSAEAFLRELPHTYFEENQVHAFIVSQIRDFDTLLAETERFLPYIDNWATCDQFSPKAFARNTQALLPCVQRWIASEKTYTVRFGVATLMRHYLGENYRPEFSDAVAAIRSDEYYVKMMAAWYFATALAKRFNDILPYFQTPRLDLWTHNMAIRKARESYRVSPEQKETLAALRRKE